MKAGIKTTEFWISMGAAIVGVVAASGFFTPDQASTITNAITQLGGIITTVAAAFGYSISRGMAKKG